MKELIQLIENTVNLILGKRTELCYSKTWRRKGHIFEIQVQLTRQGLPVDSIDLLYYNFSYSGTRFIVNCNNIKKNLYVSPKYIYLLEKKNYKPNFWKVYNEHNEINESFINEAIDYKFSVPLFKKHLESFQLELI